MKRKVINYCCDLAIAILLILMIVPVLEDLTIQYNHYKSLYINVENDKTLLESAYYFGIRICMTASIALVLYTILSSIKGWLLKYHTSKVLERYLILSGVCLTIILSIDLTIGSNLKFYKVIVVFNYILSLALAFSYSIVSYRSNKKLKELHNQD